MIFPARQYFSPQFAEIGIGHNIPNDLKNAFSTKYATFIVRKKEMNPHFKTAKKLTRTFSILPLNLMTNEIPVILMYRIGIRNWYLLQ